MMAHEKAKIFCFTVFINLTFAQRIYDVEAQTNVRHGGFRIKQFINCAGLYDNFHELMNRIMAI